MMRRRTTSKGAEVEEVLVGDIMALCIMSKCGEERCGDRFFRKRKVGTGHYGFMHNVEVWGKWVWEEAGKRGAGTGF